MRLRAQTKPKPTLSSQVGRQVKRNIKADPVDRTRGEGDHMTRDGKGRRRSTSIHVMRVRMAMVLVPATVIIAPGNGMRRASNNELNTLTAAAWEPAPLPWP